MTVSVTINVSEAGKPDFSNIVICTDKNLNAVLFDFNPSTDARVTVIKALCAALIEQMRPIADNRDDASKARTAAIAITEIEGAQMRAVKALFAK